MRRNTRLLSPFGRKPPAATPSAFAAAAYNSQAAVNTGDLVLLWFIGAGIGAPAAPTGWTRILNTTESNGYAVALYSSTYSGGNAVANTTNFPVSNGYFFTVVYAGTHTVAQVGTFSDSANSATSVTLTALSAATAAGSALAAFVSSRDNGIDPITASNGMTAQAFSTAPTFFAFGFFDQTGVQSGARTFNRTSGVSIVNNFNGVLVEIT